MALIRFPIKKSLVTAVVAGVVALGASGAAGAAGTTPAAGAAPTAAPKVNCSGVQKDLARMRHRQAVLDGKVLRLSGLDTRAAKAGTAQARAHRATVVHRNLAHWQKVRAHKINARFLRREAKLAALAAGQCQAAVPSTAAPSTAAPSTVPAGTATT